MGTCHWCSQAGTWQGIAKWVYGRGVAKWAYGKGIARTDGQLSECSLVGNTVWK